MLRSTAAAATSWQSMFGNESVRATKKNKNRAYNHQIERRIQYMTEEQQPTIPIGTKENAKKRRKKKVILLTTILNVSMGNG